MTSILILGGIREENFQRGGRFCKPKVFADRIGRTGVCRFHSFEVKEGFGATFKYTCVFFLRPYFLVRCAVFKICGFIQKEPQRDAHCH